MKTRIIITIWTILFFSALDAQETPKPFVEYPDPIDTYLTRIQKGKQEHAFNTSTDFSEWQKRAREALIELTGLKQMEKDLVGFKPKVTMGTPKKPRIPSLEHFTQLKLNREYGFLFTFWFPRMRKRDNGVPYYFALMDTIHSGFIPMRGPSKTKATAKRFLARKVTLAHKLHDVGLS